MLYLSIMILISLIELNNVKY